MPEKVTEFQFLGRFMLENMDINGQPLKPKQVQAIFLNWKKFMLLNALYVK